MKFSLPTTLEALRASASRYDYDKPETFAALSNRLEATTALSSENLANLIAWKSPRTKGKTANNAEHDVQTISRLAIAMPEPYLSVHMLTALEGVGISVASTIMAFVDPATHVIMDRHTVRALGEKNLYLGTWCATDYRDYRNFLLAERGTLSLRELEQGLFMWSREEMGKL